jgi:hypothetical protein
MKVQIFVILSTLSVLTAGVSGQCTRPDSNPMWDGGKQEFRCVAPSDTAGISRDETVSPKGNREYCNAARENLLKACPASDEGKACKSKAKSIYNLCHKDLKAQGESQAGSARTTSQTAKTDRAVCMQTFNQQQQACQARKLPPASPGQPYVPDTCLQDAIKAQNTCLANSR